MRQVLRIARLRSGWLALTDTGGLPPRMRPFFAARKAGRWSGSLAGLLDRAASVRRETDPASVRRDRRPLAPGRLMPGCTTRSCVSGWCRSIPTLHGVVFAIFTASGAPRRRCFAPRQSDSTSNRHALVRDRATNLGMVGQTDYTSKEFSEKPARKASAPGSTVKSIRSCSIACRTIRKTRTSCRPGGSRTGCGSPTP